MPDPNQSQHLYLHRLGERVFSEWEDSSPLRLPNSPCLMLYNPSLPSPDLEWLPHGSAAVLRLAAGRRETDLEWGGMAVARSSARSLPLQTASLAAVMLCHLVSRGEEPELAEACRILQPGGRLCILGFNHLGLRNLSARSKPRVPAIHALAVRSHLEALEMNVLGLYAAGFLAREWPRRMNRGAARALVPFADLFLLVAKPQEPRLLNPLAKRKMRTVGVPSAVAGR